MDAEEPASYSAEAKTRDTWSCNTTLLTANLLYNSSRPLDRTKLYQIDIHCAAREGNCHVEVMNT